MTAKYLKALLLLCAAPACFSPGAIAQGFDRPDSLEAGSGYDDEDDGADETEEIITSAQKAAFDPLRGQTPDVSFNGGDIQALGVTDMGELLDAIAAETGSDSDEPPILLLDGRPVANRREISKFPSEAVRKADVLPPESALRYSSDPDRRVINFVLRRRFNALTLEGGAGGATGGGAQRIEAGANSLRIKDSTRVALSAELTRSSAIRQSDRDIIDRNAGRLFATGGNIEGRAGAEIDPALSEIAGETVTIAGVPSIAASGMFTLGDIGDLAGNPYREDQGRFRDLQPETETLSLGASLFRPVGEHWSLNASVNADLTQSESLRGLRNTTFDIPAGNPFSPFSRDVTLYRADGPQVRRRDEQDIDAAVSLSADYARYQWQIEASHTRIDDVRETGRSLDRVQIAGIQTRINDGDPELNPFAPLDLITPSVSDRLAQSSTLKARINAQVFDLPAGPVTVAGGLETGVTELDSTTRFTDASETNSLSRRSSEARASLSIPLSGSGGRNAAGRTRLRLSGSVDDVENFGTLKSYGAGLNWNVTGKTELQISADVRERAPSLTQIGDPIFTDPNIRLTDFATGDAVILDRLSGGNPDLQAEARRDIQITAKYRHSRDLRISSRYRARRTDNDITSFPFLTPQVAIAFPDRLTRDAAGDLIGLDARPVNAYRSQVDSLRTGLNWSKRITPKTSADTPPPEDKPQTGRRRRGPTDRIGLSIYHTWRLTEDFQFRKDGPVFDLLDGSALRRLGGEAEHEVQLRLSGKRKNYGGRLSLNHETGSFISTESLGASQSRSGDLTFDPLTTADLRLYYDFGRRADGKRVKRGSFRDGLRLSLDINNITDSKQNVSSADGSVPFGYEPDALDPEGRTVFLTARKIFMTRPERSGRTGRRGAN